MNTRSPRLNWPLLAILAGCLVHGALTCLGALWLAGLLPANLIGGPCP